MVIGGGRAGEGKVKKRRAEERKGGKGREGEGWGEPANRVAEASV